MPEIKYFYVIRWNTIFSLGAMACEDAPWYSYITGVQIGAGDRGVLDDPDPQKAIKFGSWSEAAACAVFIIQHVDDLYEDALEVVMIDS